MTTEEKGTEYVVLGAASNGEGEVIMWAVVGKARAANDLVAIKRVVADRDDVGHGPFVAVPARSWRPRKREVKTRQVELWS